MPPHINDSIPPFLYSLVSRDVCVAGDDGVAKVDVVVPDDDRRGIRNVKSIAAWLVDR